MSWPVSQDYNEAIQSPATNFADPDLRRGKVVTNALGARGSAAPPPARVVAESDAELAAAALRFLGDAELSRRAGDLAHAWAT